MDDIKLFAKKEKELETLIQAVIIYSQDMGMEFGIEKCAMLIMRSREWHLTERIELPNQEKIRTLGEKETYKCLGILDFVFVFLVISWNFHLAKVTVRTTILCYRQIIGILINLMFPWSTFVKFRHLLAQLVRDPRPDSITKLYFKICKIDLLDKSADVFTLIGDCKTVTDITKEIRAV